MPRRASTPSVLGEGVGSSLAVFAVCHEAQRLFGHHEVHVAAHPTVRALRAPIQTARSYLCKSWLVGMRTYIAVPRHDMRWRIDLEPNGAAVAAALVHHNVVIGRCSRWRMNLLEGSLHFPLPRFSMRWLLARATGTRCRWMRSTVRAERRRAD